MRFASLFASLICCVVLSGLFTAQAVESKPFLWHVDDGAGGLHLFGTAHVPDPRITTLAPSVSAALDAAEEFYTEIPLDPMSMMKATQNMTLPWGETLPDILGEELHGRFAEELKRISPLMTPAPFQRFKPWAAATQMQALEVQMKWGAKPPLDMVLWTRAQNNGAEMGGIETVEEQIDVFDGLTMEEQVQLMESSLDGLDKARAAGADPLEDTIQWYLAGDPEGFMDHFTRWAGALEDNPLNKKLYDRLLVKRNVLMAERIDAMLAKKDGKRRFVALGAAHYGTDDGVLALLAAKGWPITRVEAVLKP